MTRWVPRWLVHTLNVMWWLNMAAFAVHAVLSDEAGQAVVWAVFTRWFVKGLYAWRDDIDRPKEVAQRLNHAK